MGSYDNLIDKQAADIEALVVEREKLSAQVRTLVAALKHAQQDLRKDGPECTCSRCALCQSKRALATIPGET